jgi:chorismate mutase
MRTARTETYEHTISGLLTKRQELMEETAAIREKMAIIANDVEAIDRVLETLGHTEQLEGRSPRAARIILFYRNELRSFLLDQLRKANRPMTSRELAEIVCETEGKNRGDRRLISDVTRRIGCALRKMRASRMVQSGREPSGGHVWMV